MLDSLDMGWVDPKTLGTRIDANYNRSEAVAARKQIASTTGSVSLGSLSRKVTCGPFGSTLTSGDFQPSGEVALVNPTDIAEPLFNTKPQWRISRSTLEAKGLDIFAPGTLVFARVGIYPHCGVIPVRIGAATISSRIIAAEINEKKADPYFLTAFFRTGAGQTILYSIQKVTAQPVIGTNELNSATVACPNPSLQRAIGNKIRAGEVLLEAAESASKELEQVFPRFSFQSVSNSGHWLDNKSVDPNRLESQYYQAEFLELSAVLDKMPCEVVPLSQLVSSLRHGASVTASNETDGAVRFIRGNEILQNRISSQDAVFLDTLTKAKLAPSHFTRKGDILVTRSGSVGTCAAVRPTECEIAFGSFVIAVQLKAGLGVSAEYIAAFLNSSLGRMQFRREENGAVQMNINNSELGRIRIPLFDCKTRDAVARSVETFNCCLDRSEMLVAEAIADVERLIAGNLNVDECLAQGHQLETEFKLGPIDV